MAVIVLAKSLFELLEEMENARIVLIQDGQKDNGILKEAFSCVGSDRWSEVRKKIEECLNRNYRNNMYWVESLGHGIYAKEFFKGIPELYESLSAEEREEIDKVFYEQPEINSYINYREWNVLDFFKLEANIEIEKDDDD